jgi:hypothetical protein
MNRWQVVAILLLAFSCARPAAAEEIKWLVEFDGKSEPASPTWSAMGTSKVKVEADGLRLIDDAKDNIGCYRVAWPRLTRRWKWWLRRR